MNFTKGQRVQLRMEPIGSGIPGRAETLTLHGEVKSVSKGLVEVEWRGEIGRYWYSEDDPDLRVVS